MKNVPRSLFLFIPALSILSFSPMTSQAAEPDLRGPIPFSSIDANGDKVITPQEFVEAHNMRKRLRTEANMPMGNMDMVPGFNFFDANGDNSLTEEELTQGRNTWRNQNRNQNMGMGMGMGQGRDMPDFSDYDGNGDGLLKKEEFELARAKRMQERAEQGYRLRNADQAPTFESIDSDNNGEVNQQEFERHQLQHREMMQHRQMMRQDEMRQDRDMMRNRDMMRDNQGGNK